MLKRWSKQESKRLCDFLIIKVFIFTIILGSYWYFYTLLIKIITRYVGELINSELYIARLLRLVLIPIDRYSFFLA